MQTFHHNCFASRLSLPRSSVLSDPTSDSTQDKTSQPASAIDTLMLNPDLMLEILTSGVAFDKF